MSSFSNIGAIVDGSPLVATVPQIVATQILALRKHLKTRPIPFKMPWVATELLWPATSDDDEPARFVRDKLVAIAGAAKILT